LKGLFLKAFYIKLFSIIIICSLGVIIYSNTFFTSFQLDDFSSIVANPAVKNIANLQNIWNFWPTRFISYLSVALNYHYHQLDVFGYHFLNLVIHLGSALLVWWLTLLTFFTPAMKGLKITRRAYLIAFFTGLIFAVHPVQTEGVTYIIQRSASLATLLYLGSLSLYVKSRLLKEQMGNTLVFKCCYAFSLAAAVAAMFTKEMAITLPLMVSLYELTFFKIEKSYNWKYLGPFLCTLLIIPLTMLLTQSVSFTGLHRVAEPGAGITPWQYLLTQFRVIVTYIRLLFIPLNQNLHYDYPIAANFFNLPILASLLFLVSIIISGIKLFRNYKLASFGIFWFFLALIPESSIIPIKDVIFEHRLYLPLVGYSLILVSSLYYLFQEKRIKFVILILSVTTIFYSALTYQRNKLWKNELTLWDDVIRKSPHKEKAYVEHGLFYQAVGNPNQAISEFSKAIKINPQYARAYANRGNVYQVQGNLNQAVSDYNRAIELNPYYAEAYSNRGLACYVQGNINQAVTDFNKALEINPDLAGTYRNLGDVYYSKGDFDLAILNYNKSIQINPRSALIYYNRAIAYFFKKEYSKSWDDVYKAEAAGLKLDPKFIEKLKKDSGREE